MAEMAPGDLNWCFFVSSGSEATERAMKMAIQNWQEKGIQTKTKIVSRWVSYHGITLGAMSMSGHPGRRARFVPLRHGNSQNQMAKRAAEEIQNGMVVNLGIGIPSLVPNHLSNEINVIFMRKTA
jgi:adenosylmethionine-8-amino-7-oxononanoate aminotransferase